MSRSGLSKVVSQESLRRSQSVSEQSVTVPSVTSVAEGETQGAYPLPAPFPSATSPRCQRTLRAVGGVKGARCIHPKGHHGPCFFGSPA